MTLSLKNISSEACLSTAYATGRKEGWHEGYSIGRSTIPSYRWILSCAAGVGFGVVLQTGAYLLVYCP